MQLNPKAYFWSLVKTLACAASSSSTANTTTLPNNSGGDLYFQRLRCKAFLTSAALAALAGTPLVNTASATAASDTLPANTLVTIQLKIGQQQLFSQEVSLFALHGESGRPYEFDLVLPKLISKQDLIWSVTNNTTVAVTVEIEIPCAAVPPREPLFVE